MPRSLRITIGIFLILITGAGVGWRIHQQHNATAPSNKLSVSVSFYPLWFFATQIGGSLVEVHNITPSGAEPHDYEPTSQDIATIVSGNVLILNGGVEAWGDKIVATLKGTPVRVIIAGQGLLTNTLTENGVVGVDPHVWLDPILAKREVQAIAEGLVQADSLHALMYQANAQQLLTKLDQLDSAYRTGLQTCQRQDIITSHAAFGYLAQRYHLNQVAITGLSPDAEPSTQQLADVAAFAKSHKITYIFFESLVSPKLAQTIASEVHAQTMVLDPLEGVSPQDQASGRDYLSIMRDNLRNLQLALQCIP